MLKHLTIIAVGGGWDDKCSCYVVGIGWWGKQEKQEEQTIKIYF